MNFTLLKHLILTLVFMLVACGEESPAPQPAQPTKVKTTSTEVGNQIQYLIAKSVIGDVQLLKPNQSQWKTVKVGQKLKTGFVVKTGVNSEVKFKFQDGSKVVLQANSQASLEQFVAGKTKRQAELYLAEGELLFNIKKLSHVQNDIEFTTPTATAAIRGTSGGIATNGKSSLAYLETGKLEMKAHGSNKTHNISAMEYITQTPQGFKKKKASSFDKLKEELKVKKSWMNTLKSPVLRELYTPSKAKEYFKKELDNRIQAPVKKLQNKVKTQAREKLKSTQDKLKKQSKKLQDKTQDQLKKSTEKKLKSLIP